MRVSLARRPHGGVLLAVLLGSAICLGWPLAAGASHDDPHSQTIRLDDPDEPPAPPRAAPAAGSTGRATSRGEPAKAAGASARRRRRLPSAGDPRDRTLLIFKGQAFDPREREPSLVVPGTTRPLPSTSYRPGAKRYYIVQFDDAVRPEWFEQLRQTGADTVTYLPNNAYVVRAADRLRPRLDALPNVRWIGNYEPGFKLDPSLAEASVARSPTEEIVLRVSTFPGTSAEGLRPIVLRTGRTVAIRQVSERPERGGRLLLSVTAASLNQVLDALLAQPDVQWIEEYHEPQLFNDHSSWVIQSGNQITEAKPLWDHGLTGSGQTFGIADSGLDSDACQARFSASPLAQTFFGSSGFPVGKMG